MTDVLRLPRRERPNTIHLIVNIWEDLGDRREEIEACWSSNMELIGAVTSLRGRPTFADMLRPEHQGRVKIAVSQNMTMRVDADITILANADIEFPSETIDLLRHVDMGDHAFALSRYNPTPSGLKLQWQPRGSQDCWIFQGPPKHVEADFPMGILGCDNRFAAELERAGYTVSNPCLTLKTIHRHAQSTTVWTGDADKDAKLRERAKAGLPRVPRPYKLVDPCRLEVV